VELTATEDLKSFFDGHRIAGYDLTALFSLSRHGPMHLPNEGGECPIELAKNVLGIFPIDALKLRARQGSVHPGRVHCAPQFAQRFCRKTPLAAQKLATSSRSFSASRRSPAAMLF